MIEMHGFAIIRQYGDWDYEPLAEASPSIIVVCRRQGRRLAARKAHA